MITISKKSEYGLHFLTALANTPQQQHLSITTVSKKLGLPYRFLSQIAGQLKKADLVVSREGVKGGYKLKKDPSQITLRQIIEIFDGPIGIVSCQIGKKCQIDDTCQLKNQFHSLRLDLVKLFENKKVSE